MKPAEDGKKDRILDAAAELFASLPFHKVLLSDVAGKARVGKGTLYLYFDSKDALYLAVLFREFAALVDRLHERLDGDGPADEQMRCAVRAIVRHLFGRETVVELLRGTVVNCPKDSQWNDKRLELRSMLEGVILRGIRQSIFADENPRLTAQYIPGMIRSVCLYRIEDVSLEELERHACEFVLKALSRR